MTFPRLAVALLAAVSCGLAQATLIFHDPADIPIPADFDGVYIDFDNFSDPSSFSIGSSPPGPGGAWDLNFFFGGIGIGNSDTLRPVTDTSPSINADVLNLSFGDTVGPSPSVGTFPAGQSGSSNHIGTGTNEFPSGQSGLIGFRLQPDSFTPNSTGEHFGIMSVTLLNDGSAGAIHWWAWETIPDTAITATAIPEASEVGLLGLGLAGLLSWRRRLRGAAA